MDKKDIKLNMLVSVVQNTNTTSRKKNRVRRVGRVVGIYNNYVNLLLYACDFLETEPETDSNKMATQKIAEQEIATQKITTQKIIIQKKLYNETFKFYEISEIRGELIWENI